MTYFGIIGCTGVTADHEVMQYTGFKAIKNTDVYEGDILENWGGDEFPEKHQVIFDTEIRQWMWGDIPLYELGPEEGAIIGNIYENPELLNPASSQ